MSLAELRAAKGTLDQRWKELTIQLNSLLRYSPQQLQLDADYQSTGVWVGLRGSVCERIQRNRGGPSFVAPLCALPGQLHAWIGLQEVWEAKTGARPFAFKTLSVTVYCGFQGDPKKPQVLRLEWPGIDIDEAGGAVFQSHGAGHPHWQVDVLQSLAARGDLEEFTLDQEEVVEDFSSQGAQPDISAILGSLTIEDMHLASAAPWWIPASDPDVRQHMHAPASVAALSAWLCNGVEYVRQELARCSIRI